MALKGLSAVRAGLERPSGWILVAVNLAVLPAVLIFDWSVFEIIFLFWAENVVIGVINVLKMLTARPLIDTKAEALDQNTKLAVAAVNWGILLFMVPFFIIHYGGFCFGHGIFVFSLFSDSGDYGQDLWTAVPALLAGGLALPLALLAASHLYSFVFNYLGGDEYHHTNPTELMARPYGRIVVLHITIIFGGFLTMALGDPTWMLVVLVLVKTLVDLAMHGRERQKYTKEQMLTS